MCLECNIIGEIHGVSSGKLMSESGNGIKVHAFATRNMEIEAPIESECNNRHWTWIKFPHLQMHTNEFFIIGLYHLY